MHHARFVLAALVALASTSCSADLGARAEWKDASDKGTGPSILSVAYGTIAQHSVVVRVSLGADASVVVDYDLNEWPKVVENREYASEHVLVLDRLRAGATHEFTIEATLPDGSSTLSETISVETLDYPGTSAFLPPGWSSTDIGLVSTELPGSAWSIDGEVGDSFVIDGTGTDIYFTRDSFHFVHYPVDGDFRLTFRVDGYSGYLHFWTKAFAQFRTGLGEGASMFTQSLNYEGFDYLYFREMDDDWHTDITFSQLNEETGSPVWARLTRTDDFFLQEYSHDGVTWLVHGPGEGTEVPIPTSGFIGIGVCGKSNSYLSQITYSNVVIEHCGDGIVTWGDICDDGNHEAGDGCSSSCLVEAEYTCTHELGGPSVCTPLGCGDARLDPREECDDGAGNSDAEPDACRMDCTLPRCGDSVVDSREACDDGADNSDTEPDACRRDCSLPVCGDGVPDAGEACDDGELNSDTDPDVCRSACELPACGDGVIDSGEECDDADEDAEDGCDRCVTMDLDLDDDGVPNRDDNCPTRSNADQLDLDADGAGDVCDADDDQDGLADAIEDADSNGLRSDDETDPRNPDTDGDGLCDGWSPAPLEVDEIRCEGGEDLSLDGIWDVTETDPLAEDTDGDCALDGEESLGDPATDPLDPDNTPVLPDEDSDGVPDRCDLCLDVPGELSDGCPVVEPPDRGADVGRDVGDVMDDVGLDTTRDVLPDGPSDVGSPDVATDAPDTGDARDVGIDPDAEPVAPDSRDDALSELGETAMPDGALQDAQDAFGDARSISSSPRRGCGTAPGPSSTLSIALAVLLALPWRTRRRT